MAAMAELRALTVPTVNGRFGHLLSAVLNDCNQSLSVFQERQRDGQLWVEEPLADAE